MGKKKTAVAARRTRHLRVRRSLSGTPERPRLNIFRSASHIYAQVIDDTVGHTLAAAHTQEAADGLAKADAAREVGKMVAGRAKAKGVSKVVFDRSGYKYHGRVKALADAAREEGLEF